MDEEKIRQITMNALDFLKEDMAFNRNMIEEITFQFVKETPNLIATLHDQCKNEDWPALAATLHKIKSRFAYVGFDEIEQDLGSWEMTLKTGSVIADLETRLSKVDIFSNQIIDVLKESEFYRPTNDQTSMASTSEKKSVLIAEDDDVNATIIESIIKEWGGESIRAYDGFEAIAKTAEEKPDLIIMDVHMPFLNGVDAIRVIRGKGIETTIISMSASHQLNEKEDTINAGGHDFLTKPVDTKLMENLLDKYL